MTRFGQGIDILPRSFSYGYSPSPYRPERHVVKIGIVICHPKRGPQDLLVVPFMTVVSLEPTLFGVGPPKTPTHSVTEPEEGKSPDRDRTPSAHWYLGEGIVTLSDKFR